MRIRVGVVILIGEGVDGGGLRVDGGNVREPVEFVVSLGGGHLRGAVVLNRLRSKHHLQTHNNDVLAMLNKQPNKVLSNTCPEKLR